MNRVEQTDFSVGQISDDFVWQTPLAVRARSLRTARNVRLKSSGICEVRPGTVFVAAQDGDGWVVDTTIGGAVFILVFTALKARVYDKATRAEIASFAGAWTGAQLPDLTIIPYANRVLVLHPTMQPQMIERAAATGAWSVNAYTFADGVGGSKRQPYYRFAADGVTLTPSARSGAINLTASSTYFNAAHVGTRLRLQGREVAITDVNNPTLANATVVQELHPSYTVPVASAAGFQIGEIIEGLDSKARGEITAIAGATLTVLMLNFNAFAYTAGPPVGEKIAGPSATTTMTAAATVAANAAVVDWDEQAMSALRGWPATGAVHKNRLWLGRFPDDRHGRMPFAIMASAVDDFHDFDMSGAEDADALFEFVSDASAGPIQHIVASEQLLVMTSRRLYYCPESESNPIRPTSFFLIQVGPDGANDCTPVLISEGVLFVTAGGGAVTAAFPTGDIRRSWRTANMGYLTKDVVKTPRDMAYVADATYEAVTGDDKPNVRYVYVVNDDGSMAVLSYTQTDADAIPGWTSWATDGTVRSVCAIDGECWALVKRYSNYRLEVFEGGRILDGTVKQNRNATYQRAALPAEQIAGPSGQMPGKTIHRNAARAGLVQALVLDGVYVGRVQIDASGDFPVPDLPGAFIELGHSFVAEVQPWPALPQPGAEGEPARRRRRRIVRAWVRWKGRGMMVDGVIRPLYDGGEDTGLLPPLRDEFTAFPLFGRSYEPTFTVGGDAAYPAFWTLLGLSAEVAA